MLATSFKKKNPQVRYCRRHHSPDAVFTQRGDHRGKTLPPPRPLLAPLVRLSLRTMGYLPLPVAQTIGSLLGLPLLVFPNRVRRVVGVNLRIAFPQLTSRARRRLARRSLLAAGRTAAETGAAWTWPQVRLDRLIREVEGEALLRDSLESGRGVILAAPHHGSWELLGAYCSSRYPLTTLYRPQRMREIRQFVRHGRQRFGMRLVDPAKVGVRTLIGALRSGEMVALLPDQDAGRGLGVFAPFFGEMANTMVLLPRLAARTRAVVVIGWVERLGLGRGFRIHFSAASDGIYDADVARAAATMNRDLEAVIRRCPEQYLWSYKRWRIRPPGCPSPYAGQR